jgi:hypothetical protein
LASRLAQQEAVLQLPHGVGHLSDFAKVLLPPKHHKENVDFASLNMVFIEWDW